MPWLLLCHTSPPAICSFKDFTAARPASALLSPEDYARISAALRVDKEAAAAKAAAEAAAAPAAPPAPPAAESVAPVAAPVGESTPPPGAPATPPATDSAPVTDTAMPDAAPADQTAPATAREPPAVAEAFPAAPAGDAAIQMDVIGPPGTGAEPAVPAVPVQQPAAAVVPVEVTEDEVKGSWLAGQDAVYQVLGQLGWALCFHVNVLNIVCMQLCSGAVVNCTSREAKVSFCCHGAA